MSHGGLYSNGDSYARARERASTPEHRARQWYSKHAKRHGVLAFAWQDVVPWMRDKPDVCPYTGDRVVVLHMNQNTLEIEGWVGSWLNGRVLPFFRDSIHEFLAVNPGGWPMKRSASPPLPADEGWMSVAVREAQLAADSGDAPFGCLVVDEGSRVLARASGSETPDDCTRHSEVKAIAAAMASLGGDLRGCTVYSTHQPCTMCSGAVAHSLASRLVYGSRRADFPDVFRPKIYGVEEILSDTSHDPEVVGGVLHGQCVDLLRGWTPNPPRAPSGILRDECKVVTAAAPWLPPGGQGVNRR